MNDIPETASVTGTIFTGPVYHVYPLGMLGAPHTQTGVADPLAPDDPGNIRAIADWIPHLKRMNAEAMLFGPIFSSESHGYDILDLSRIDPRLGTNEDFKRLTAELHRAGISVLLDGVFNHVGRGFFAFQDVVVHREASAYREWFSHLRFDRPGPAGDGIDYATWVRRWIDDFEIDGLRLDAADVIDPSLWPELRATVDAHYRGNHRFGRGRFWLNGEMVHGDYASICGPDALDGTTNYEVYKGLYSSHNDKNYHEIAHSLERQFAPGGIYRGLRLLSFADNHDVPRIASTLADPRHLYPLHLLLFTIPGTPAIYYGSETGVPGVKDGDDWPLRPALTPDTLVEAGRHPDLAAAIIRLSHVRHAVPDLAGTNYDPISVADEQIVFRRGATVVAVNAADHPASVSIPAGIYRDELNDSAEITGDAPVELPPLWGRVLVPQ
ncbi:MAG: alpha-amylase family glycosyl hydrolase [Alkalispirochaeta sp.]